MSHSKVPKELETEKQTRNAEKGKRTLGKFSEKGEGKALPTHVRGPCKNSASPSNIQGHYVREKMRVVYAQHTGIRSRNRGRGKGQKKKKLLWIRNEVPGSHNLLEEGVTDYRSGYHG